MKKGRVFALVVSILFLASATAGCFFRTQNGESASASESGQGTQTEVPDSAVLKTSSNTAYPGDFIAFTVTGAPNAKLSAELEGQALQLSSYVKDNVLVGLLAVPLEVTDLSTLTIHAGDISSQVSIRAKTFPTIETDVPAGEGEADADKDISNFEAALEKGPKEPTWSDLFLFPVSGKITEDFGAILTSSGNEVGRSGDVTIQADEGTPVSAASDGEVVFVGDMSTGGKTIIIAHGLGVCSVYQHLQDISVKEGSTVKKGDSIGTVGKTGAVKSAQLTYSVVIAGTPVDPFLMTTKNPLEILK